jgi:glucoamylase
MQPRGDRRAFGGPGIEPRWSHSNKEGIGTAYSSDSRLWYTLWRGIVTEVYYPRIDRAQLRDLEFLLTDGASLFLEEKRHLEATTERPNERALGFTVRSEDPEGRLRLVKSVIADPHQPCLLVRTKLEVLDPELVGKLRLFALVAPHLEVGGWGNYATVYELLGQPLLAAEKGETALAVMATVPFVHTSVGYVGASDGYTDVSQHGSMAWEFDRAPDGNVALTAEIPVGATTEFTLGLAFGDSIQSAATTLYQSLATPFEVHHRRFLDQWQRTSAHELPLARRSGDKGQLYHASRATLLAHEDKLFPGAFIASLSIPWGAAKTDEDRGGYHLVWTRDMAHCAMGLLASGAETTALRALVYLATQQKPDGGFPQNFWVDGTPYWHGVQLDEVALPILLAAKLKETRSHSRFDPEPMVRQGARFLIERGPATEEDRWEEVGGYSPSTIATSIAALTVASGFVRAGGDAATAAFIQDYADFLESHVDQWTVTRSGTLVKGIPRHYVRVRPASVHSTVPDEGPDLGTVYLPNLPPGTPDAFPASEIVDAGFLDLVRYGVRAPDDPLVVDSLKVVDRVLKVDTPYGPVWRRYNRDGYGQRDDGGPYVDWGQGRAWPVLTGERGHYELAAGNDPAPYLEAMERFATTTGLVTEQVWDGPDLPAIHAALGRPTEAAMPLAWAHAEYLELLRSAADGKVFDRVQAVAERYQGRGRRTPTLEYWTFNRQTSVVPPGATLRVVAGARFRLRASDDDWRTPQSLDSRRTGLGLEFVDLAPLAKPGRSWKFTFYWPDADRWEGRDFEARAVELA